MKTRTPPKNPIFVAIDTNDLPTATSLAVGLSPFVGGIKIGLEFFNTFGPDGVRQMTKLGTPLFLDLKLHDIPNTVAAAVRAVTWLEPYFLTLHTSGGFEMLRAAADAAHETAAKHGLQRPNLLGVTALTSLSDAQCHAIYGRKSGDVVLTLSELAHEAGLDGLVASAAEVSALRQHFGQSLTLVTPGIRPAGSAADDQSRVMTPQEALTAGADYLVVGRPITQAASPTEAVKKMLQK